MRAPHRRSPLLLVLALVALVACQLAAAAQVCGPGPSVEAQPSSVDGGHGCHDIDTDEAPAESSDCPDIDQAPDWGKQPAFQPLASGPEWRPLLRRIASMSPDMACVAPPGQAPPLIEFCRLLI